MWGVFFTYSHLQIDQASAVYTELDWSHINQYRSKVALFPERTDFELEAGEAFCDDQRRQKCVSLSVFPMKTANSFNVTFNFLFSSSFFFFFYALARNKKG